MLHDPTLDGHCRPACRDPVDDAFGGDRVDAGRRAQREATSDALSQQFAGAANGGLIVAPSSSSVIHRDFIVQLAAKHRLPAVYPARYFSDVGGLLSYGPDLLDQYRHAAGYVDRILKGEKPGMLPVQAPTKYELVINLKTAKALDLPVPPTLLDRADVVIE